MANVQYPLRTRFGRDIVTEFLPPVRPSRKVVILCKGMPGSPNVAELLVRFSRLGYWAFGPRYRGSWESGGSFLRRSPHEDILDIIHQLPRGFQGVGYTKPTTWRVKPSAVHIVAGSFGGPAGLLASIDQAVTSVVAISPVVEWRAQSKSEPLPALKRMTRSGFGGAYRFTDRDWAKLATGRFYNPMPHARSIDGKKIFIIHAKDDPVVRWNEVAQFAEQTGAKFLLLPRGGHLSMRGLDQTTLWPKIRAFIK